jgi:hypothetical protein
MSVIYAKSLIFRVNNLKLNLPGALCSFVVRLLRLDSFSRAHTHTWVAHSHRSSPAIIECDLQKGER